MGETVATNRVIELSFGAAGVDPAMELDLLVTDPAGTTRRVPGFWAGGERWVVRYSSPLPGVHRWRTECAASGLADRNGELTVAPSSSNHPLYDGGALRVAAGGRHLEQADGTPFFWLGDTWWMALCGRLRGDEFETLARDRVAKGFNLIQLVAGLFPDMAGYDPRGANEGGQAWLPDWAGPNPAWWDHADGKVRALVEAGLMPALLGCWGYYLLWLGVARMKRHWRYLIARWGAYPVVWVLAGEGAMPWYLTDTRDEDRAAQIEGWSELARYVRATDPFGRLITIHPTDQATKQVNDRALLDLDMLQTGHGDWRTAAPTLRLVSGAVGEEPPLPVINGEVCYEGIGGGCGPQIQRLMFWLSILSGARGYTYGANGLWQVNRDDEPYGPSPHGMAWGGPTWDEAMRLPGGAQLGLARRLLERYEWWRLGAAGGAEPDPHGPLAATIPDQLWLVYLPTLCAYRPPEIQGLGMGERWRAWLFNPVDGAEHPVGEAVADDQGRWRLPTRLPLYQDWLLVLER
ncbi:MAG: DUF4038 domain-containing protein [Armatimonadetes bacterium]|nr:DUF4038 domain-containing protein [Armatimonadota bacterium]